MSDFWEAYKDPRWQRKRLEVMEAAGFRCAHCGDASATLNVHHRYYIQGNKPWEYDDCVFTCLCEPCHEKTTALITKLKMCGGLLSQKQLHVLVSIASVLLAAESSAPVEVKSDF